MDHINKVAILTPSRVADEQRFSFASSSLDSLNASLAEFDLEHIVVHDSPVWGKFLPNWLSQLLPSFQWDEKAKNIYDLENINFVNGENSGSAAALLRAAKIAVNSGKTYGFIHLDDHVYSPNFGELLSKGVDAMEADSRLQWMRFSGYPIIFNNRTDIEAFIKEDSIRFDVIKLSPIRSLNYTAWVSPLTQSENEGEYWPIALWFCVYRLDFLVSLLEHAIDKGAKHLASAEMVFKTGGGISWIVNKFPKSLFGYINMQFGGIEMHQNRNWRVLLSLENREIR